MSKSKPINTKDDKEIIQIPSQSDMQAYYMAAVQEGNNAYQATLHIFNSNS